MQKLHQLRESIGKWGLAKMLWAAVMWRAHQWLMLCQIQVRVNKHAISDLAANDIIVRLANRQELIQATKEIPDYLTQEFVESAMARGDICAAVFSDSKIIAFNWASFTTTKVNDHLWVEFGTSHRYGYNAYTRPEYRGRRIMRSVMRFLDSECLKRGYTHTIVYVETHNYASLANLARLGNRCVGYAGYFRLFGKYFLFRSPGSKARSFRFYRSGEGSA